MNSLIVSGHLTADVETRAVGERNVQCFTVAINQGEHATFLPVEAWDKPHLAEWIGKGSKVLIRGAIRQNSWETPEGERRSRTLATAYEVEFLSSPRSGDEPSGEKPGAQRAAPAQPYRQRPPAPQKKHAHPGVARRS